MRIDVISHDIVWHRCQIMHTFMSYIPKSKRKTHAAAGNIESVIAMLQSLGVSVGETKKMLGERISTIEYVPMQKQWEKKP